MTFRIRLDSSSDREVQVDDQAKVLVLVWLWFISAGSGVRQRARLWPKAGGITRLYSGGSESGVLPGMMGRGAGGAPGKGALEMRPLWGPRSPWPLAKPHSTASAAIISRAI